MLLQIKEESESKLLETIIVSLSTISTNSTSIKVAKEINAAACKKGYIEEARTYLSIFNKQHPHFGIERDTEDYISALAFAMHESRHRNKSYGELQSHAFIENIKAHTRKWSWVTDRLAHFFACHNRNSNILYYELPSGKSKKISLYKETMEKGIDFKLWKIAIKNETNQERQREMIEKVGEENYLDALMSKVIHEDVDSKGNKRKLMQIFDYSFACKSLTVVRVVCPSTKRVYYLKPPRQHAKTCEEAVSSTFNLDISYRHGDVGLVAVDENGNMLDQQLISES